MPLMDRIRCIAQPELGWDDGKMGGGSGALSGYLAPVSIPQSKSHAEILASLACLGNRRWLHSNILVIDEA